VHYIIGGCLNLCVDNVLDRLSTLDANMGEIYQDIVQFHGSINLLLLLLLEKAENGIPNTAENF
jgi:hypothetical protein